MGLRCAVNIGGYCSSPKRRAKPPRVPKLRQRFGVMVLDAAVSRKCDVSPDTCGFFITWQEECRRLSVLEAEIHSP